MIDLLPWMFDGLGTAVVGIGAARARPRLLSRAASRKVRTTLFTAGPDPHMAAFYEHFTATIAAARHGVYLTGDGFGSAPECEKLARGLVASLRQVLSRGVPVIRLQTHPVASDLWQDQLKALVGEFPGLFELRVQMHQALSQPLNLCAIDVDDPVKNVTEMMIEMPRYLGTQRHQAAATAVFVEGHHMLAQTVRDRILELAQDPAGFCHLRTAEAVAGFFHGEHYFAYGSNMDPAQMATRCPSAMMTGVAMLPGHRLVFNRSGTYRPGGVANIQPAPGDRVYGVLWKLASTDLAALDQTEDPRAYHRERLRAYTLSGQPQDCHIYFATPDQPDTPDLEYLDTLIRAGHNAGLPPEYLAQLNARRPPPPPGPAAAQPARPR
jgi:hypothetical protein